jgi:hypothetical protein
VSRPKTDDMLFSVVDRGDNWSFYNTSATSHGFYEIACALHLHYHSGLNNRRDTQISILHFGTEQVTIGVHAIKTVYRLSQNDDMMLSRNFHHPLNHSRCLGSNARFRKSLPLFVLRCTPCYDRPCWDWREPGGTCYMCSSRSSFITNRYIHPCF